MNKEKIDKIYRENAAMIYKYLCGLTQDNGLAEELTQETFFQAIKGIDKFRGYLPQKMLKVKALTI